MSFSVNSTLSTFPGLTIFQPRVNLSSPWKLEIHAALDTPRRLLPTEIKCDQRPPKQSKALHITHMLIPANYKLFAKKKL